MKVLLLVCLLALGACGKKGSSSKKITRYFVKGDPMALVQGTNRETTNFMTPMNVADFSDYSMSGLAIFAEKEEMIEESQTGSIEEGNEATESDETKDQTPAFNLTQIDSVRYAFQRTDGLISFNFDLENQQLILKSISLGKSEFKIVAEHYSVTSDKSKMSILARVPSLKNDNILISATFYKHSPKSTIRKVSTNYKYIYGPGVAVPWKLNASRKISVGVCPTVTKKHEFSEVERAFKAWETPFMNKGQKLEIDVREKASCKPFSDVNEHNIHLVPSYLTMPEVDAYNPASTLIQGDMDAGHIFDADILIFEAEIAKDPNYTSSKFSRTMTHELGHFLGLDHMFDGPRSIMSYNQVYSLGYYDNEAITNLYAE